MVSAGTNELDALCSALVNIVENLGKKMDEYRDEPATGSIAARELAALSDPTPLKTAFSQGVQRLVAAGDHCFALERVLRPSAQSHAPWSIARGVLEASSVAKWLLDPSLDIDTRLSRSMSLRLSSLREQKKFAGEGLDGRPEMVKSFDQISSHTDERIQHVVSQANQLGIPEKRDAKKRLLGFGEGLPNKINLAQQVFGDAWVYRILSGVAHGESWATLVLTMRRVGERNAVTQHLTPEAVRFLVIRCIDWFAHAVWVYFALNGWDMQKLATSLEENYRLAHIDPRRRFWQISAGKQP